MQKSESGSARSGIIVVRVNQGTFRSVDGPPESSGSAVSLQVLGQATRLVGGE
jgi:hypothetical protein